MGSITLTDVVAHTLTDAGVINNNNNALRGTLNGGIDNSNIASNAQISPSKLATPGGTTEFLRSDGSWAAAVPTGCVLPFAAATPPSGWLSCDGSAVSQSTYAALYAVIGFTYGNPGGGNFSLPDLRARVVVGVGPGAVANVDTVGKNDGVGLSGRSITHRHTVAVSDPGHAHLVARLGYAQSGSTANEGGGTGANVNSQSAYTGISITAGPAGYPTDAPAFMTLAYIIKT